MNTWVIIGCGYTGRHLARRLLDTRVPVVLTRRADNTPDDLGELVDAGASYRSFDIDHSPVDVSWITDGAVVVVSTPPSREPGAAGTREAALATALGNAGRLVYLSSTGVYPRGDGSGTSEATPVAPAAAHGEARLAAETAMLDGAARANLPAVSLRIAGIYGPGRGVVERMRAGSYRIIGDGSGLVSRIHVEDLVSAIVAAGSVEPLPHHVVNVADDEPCPSLEYARAVARSLAVAEPPVVAVDQVSPRIAALVGSNRRVVNERLKRDFGVRLRYPSWRDSLAELVG